MSPIHHARQDGAAIVEMALILPILLLLVLGMIEFARGFNARIALSHASREGVRVLAITADADDAVTTTKNAANPLDPDLLTVTTTDCTPGQPTSVSVSYPFTYTIPFFGTGTLTLETTAVMRCGG